MCNQIDPFGQRDLSVANKMKCCNLRFDDYIGINLIRYVSRSKNSVHELEGSKIVQIKQEQRKNILFAKSE